MAYNNDKISQGLSFQYAEKQKEKKTNYAAVNNKTVVGADYNGSESFKKMQEGLKKSEKKSDVKEVSFKEEFTNNRKYIDEIMLSDNANNKALFLNVLNKRKAELNGYLMTGSKAHEKQIIDELKNINSIFTEYKDVISELESNGVIQKSKNNSLFRID